MTRKKYIKLVLLWGFFFLALGGGLLHLTTHPWQDANAYFVPLISGLISVFLLPFLFWFRQTIAYAYVINGFTVILGTIIMAHYSLPGIRNSFTLSALLFNTLSAQIFMLWGKFAIGKALFDLEFLRTDQDRAPGGRYFRYPNMGWWWVHFLALAIVYTIGAVLWR
jgi:hypothetical protein